MSPEERKRAERLERQGYEYVGALLGALWAGVMLLLFDVGWLGLLAILIALAASACRRFWQAAEAMNQRYFEGMRGRDLRR